MTTFIAYFWVAIGGAMGSVARFAMARNIDSTRFPYATLAANLLAAFILGLLAAAVAKQSLPPSAKWWGITGFCGGLSTFFTFSNENFLLLKANQYDALLLNVLLNLLGCFVAIVIGYQIHKA